MDSGNYEIRLAAYLRDIIYSPDTACLNREGLSSSASKLADSMDILLQFIQEERRLALDVSLGKIRQARLPARENVFCGPIKSVHSMLQHLIWLMDRIKNGDFEQRLHFANDLSDSFNSMVEYLMNLAYLSYHDGMTDLYNLEGFDERSKALLAMTKSDEQYYIVSININNFKRFVMLYGTDKGDRFLIRAATFLKSLCQKKEICARVHTDNFLCLLKGTVPEIMDRIHAGEAELVHAVTYSTNLFHYGVCAVPKENLNIRSVRDQAVFAGIQAKFNPHSDYAVFDTAMAHQYYMDSTILQRFHKAMDNDEIKVFYQPKVDTRSGHVISSEALVRWFLPNGKIILPSNFIELLEKDSLIIELDYYILKKVCSHLKKRLAEHLPLVPVSVNFSRVHLLDSDMVGRIVHMLADYGIDSKWISIEITETVFFERMENMIHIIKELHNAGFRVSMDDFGSGYSSLNFLKNIPVDEIKIDKLFFDNIDGDERGQLLLGDILSIAKHLGLYVVAEGVETEFAVQFLKKHHCNAIQGFYFYHTLPELEYEQLLGRS
jgi:diguanylate cyclase (GGDEF)-like protein